MNSFLFTYNPNNWNWDRLQEDVSRVSNGETLELEWSCTSYRKIKLGDKVFLMQLGQEPKGIIGSGIVVSEPFEKEHWNSEKAKAGKKCHKVMIEFDKLKETPIVSEEILKSDKILSSYSWFPQSSGIPILDNAVVQRLDELLGNNLNNLLREWMITVKENYINDRDNAGQKIGTSAFESFKKAKSYFEMKIDITNREGMHVKFNFGSGRWINVPYLAIWDNRFASTTQNGIYIVYLFCKDMSGVYLTLIQGTKDVLNGNSKKHQEGLKYLKENARRIGEQFYSLKTDGFYFDRKMDLFDSRLGKDYEAASILYKYYSTDAIPSEGILENDISLLIDAYVNMQIPPRLEESSRIENLFEVRITLEDWIQNLNHNTTATIGKYHYKEVLILALLDLLDAQEEHKNLFEFNELFEYFHKISESVGVSIEKKNFKHPFEKLGNDTNPIKVWLFDGESSATIAEDVWSIFASVQDRLWIRSLLKKSEEREEIIQAIDVVLAVPELITSIEETGFFYQPWQITAFVTALMTKPFVILAGVTGTGKSKLPSIIAKLTGASHTLIPVRPDWTDSSDILGYTDLTGNFRPGELLRFARAASESPNIFHVCIIDEMNIARVEHYFAEILSRIEDREIACDGGYHSSKLLAKDERIPNEWLDTRIPPNMVIVGTVNMDESTHGFSKKVLDRAFTIELSDIDLSKWQSSKTQSSVKYWPASTWFPKAIRLGELSNLSDKDTRKINGVIDDLQVINKILNQGQLQIGYRARDEIVLFVLNAMKLKDSFVTTDQKHVEPLDLAIHMKILPRIIGGSHSVRLVVEGLLKWAWNASASEDIETKNIINDWKKMGRPETFNSIKYARTVARLCLMYDRFEEGFTSYWL